MRQLRGWKFDEIEDKSSSTEKPNSYSAKALQQANDSLDKGTYTLHHNNSLFARFDVKNKRIELHKWSENTGMLMPCWNYFEE